MKAIGGVGVVLQQWLPLSAPAAVATAMVLVAVLPDAGLSAVLLKGRSVPNDGQ